jgi:HSP20 family protein
MLTRWDPFREMITMRRAMDRLIENSFSDDMEQTPEWGLALDVVEDEDRYLVKASVPGIQPDDLEITYAKGMLTIKGETKDESERSQGQYHLRERRFGSFSRSISLPSHIKAEEIQADYKDGVLTLALPKAEEVKPKRIPIGSGEGQKVIEGHTKNGQ